MNRIKHILLSVIILAGAAYAFTPTDKYFAIAKNLDIFASLFKEINALYVDEVDPEALVGTGINAMLESLDPYTNYISEEQVENFRSMTTGQYAGIGAIIARINDRVIITMPYASFAADKAGLKIGDEIISINGIPVRGKPIGQISDMLKGQAKTKVDVTVKRYGKDELKTFSFNRERVKIKNVPYYSLMEKNIGYIKLEDFTIGAGREVGDALERLKLQGATKIILDLRDNPGGLLNEAVNVVNVFIPKGKVVVETKGRVEEWNKSYKTLNHPVDTDIPVIVLVNENSASASEIVSGAIQDYDRGILIGRKTFGKGLVQTTRALSYNAQLKITTAKYYTPSGRCIQSIDYASKDKNGNGTSFPDSVRVAYKTMNGRVVFDGDGLQPDIEVKKAKLSAIASMLEEEGFLFDYATKWYYENPNAGKFPKTDEEYNRFKSWLNDKDFIYHTEVESLIHHLKTSAEKEAYYKELQGDIASLEHAVTQDKKNDLEKFKNEILELLEEEISARIALYEGQLKASFDNDTDLAKSFEIFKSEEALQQILTRN